MTKYVLRFLCPGCHNQHTSEAGPLADVLRAQSRVLNDGCKVAAIYTEAAWLSCQYDHAEEAVANPQNLADVLHMTSAARATHDMLSRLANPGKSD